MRKDHFSLLLSFALHCCKQVQPQSLSNLNSAQLPLYEQEGFSSDSDHFDYIKCKNSGFIFNRLQSPTKGECTKIPLAKSYQCNVQSIHEKFMSIGITIPVTSINNNFKFEEFPDFDIDQCGEVEDFPLVILIRKDIEDSTDLSFEVKNLCKADSPACLK
jgi:hypothetical protein